MDHLCILSKENLALARFEAVSLLKPTQHELKDNFLFLTEPSGIFRHLAYTRLFYRVLFSCNHEVLLPKIKNFDWNNYCKNTFSISVSGLDNKEEIIDAINESITSASVDLQNPETSFLVKFIDGRVYVLLKLWENIEKFANRRSHLRPRSHPTSLDPKLARACINLAGKTSGTIIDPFCGSGGILIEAGLLGFFPVGYDISAEMLESCRVNLLHYNVTEFELKNIDARQISKKASAIVTDIPYGQNSGLNDDLVLLVRQFLNNSVNLTDTIVLMYPQFLGIKPLLGAWKIEKEFERYVHKSLTKRIALLRL